MIPMGHPLLRRFDPRKHYPRGLRQSVAQGQRRQGSRSGCSSISGRVHNSAEWSSVIAASLSTLQRAMISMESPLLRGFDPRKPYPRDLRQSVAQGQRRQGSRSGCSSISGRVRNSAEWSSAIAASLSTLQRTMIPMGHPLLRRFDPRKHYPRGLRNPWPGGSSLPHSGLACAVTPIISCRLAEVGGRLLAAKDARHPTHYATHGQLAIVVR